MEPGERGEASVAGAEQPTAALCAIPTTSSSASLLPYLTAPEQHLARAPPHRPFLRLSCAAPSTCRHAGGRTRATGAPPAMPKLLIHPFPLSTLLCVHDSSRLLDLQCSAAVVTSLSPLGLWPARAPVRLRLVWVWRAGRFGGRVWRTQKNRGTG
jgi:hypothetical protein